MAGAAFLLVCSGARAETCEEAAGVAVLPSPLTPWKGEPLRVIFTAEKPLEGELSLVAPDGSVAVASHDRHGGPPYSWFAEAPTPAVGTLRARFVCGGSAGGGGTNTKENPVHASQPSAP